MTTATSTTSTEKGGNQRQFGEAFGAGPSFLVIAERFTVRAERRSREATRQSAA